MKKRGHAFLHGAGGFVGKRDGENRVGQHAEIEKVSDAVGDDTRLAGASASQDQQRAAGGFDSFALAWI
jgi:hypothetical protein